MKYNYQFFSSEYDELMGKKHLDIYDGLTKKALKSRKISGKAILDLGCGTGTLLKKYSKTNSTYGLDISKKMLAVAKIKDKKTVYRQANIYNFSLKERFDIIFCTFDTINHLLSWNQWRRLFGLAAHHLKNRGVFIFDFNTPDKFKRINGVATIKSTKQSYVIMKTEAHGRFCTWHIDIFKKAGNGNFKLYQERITETSFDKKIIERELKKYFTVKIVEGKNRIYCVCKKRLG